MEYIKRIAPAISSSCFLFGPRGTGKSTWLRRTYPHAVFIDLLDRELYRIYSAYPERIEKNIQLSVASQNSKVVIIDEIQRVPELLAMIHKVMESRKDLTFILTGSSARKLKRKNVDLLGGRAALATMHPYMAFELGERFSLEKSLQIGLLPLVWGARDAKRQLKGYISLYLDQEIKAEGIIRNISNFSRFLEALSFSHGHVINLSSIARDCQVQRSSVDNYTEIAEDLLIFKRIPVFAKRAKRALISHSKAYFFDCGVFRYVRPRGPLDQPEELTGQALEGLVFQHLQAWIDYSGSDTRLYFWRTQAGSEVDFVLYGSECFCAIEVKNSARIRTEDLRPLRTFRDDYPEASVACLYRGRIEQVHNDIPCIPVENFLKALAPGGKIPFMSI